MKTALQILEKALEIRESLIERGETDFEGNSLECWDVSVNPRLTRCAGKCKYREAIIELSFPLFSDESNFLTELRETVLHEFAHAIAGPCINKQTGRRSPHGWKWRSVLSRIGGNGARTHKMKTRKKSRKASPKYTVYCGRCRKALPMGKTQYRRMRDEGMVYRHRRCGGTMFVSLDPVKGPPKKKLVPGIIAGFVDLTGKEI